MSMLFSRTFIIPVWVVVFALFAVSGWPMPVVMAMLLLIVGVAVPAIILMLWKESPAVAVALHPVDASGKTDDAFGRLKPRRASERDSDD